jgi:RNA polymerase sigma-70 factor (ECF subfamily)
VNLYQLKEPDRFAPWLRRVTFSVAMNWLKAFRPSIFQQLDGQIDLETLEIPDFRPGPAEELERRELAQAVHRAIASLPPRYRVPLTMFHLDGLSYQKVAEFLDIPLRNVRVLIHRARAKLKALLSDYVTGEVGAMVQEVFNEHKLPAEFAQRVLDNVPLLRRDKKFCTFAGALEAALAVTEHPYSYTDLLGFSGLAFRARWWSKPEPPRWCPSSAVGEMEEEALAVEKATGWTLRYDFVRPDDALQVEKLTGRFVGSINCGKPALAYDAGLVMGVVYGYEGGGKTLFMRGYSSAEPLKLAPAKLGSLTLFIGEQKQAPPAGEAFVESLRMAVRNWKRERFSEGPGEYWYGSAAMDRWIADLSKWDEYSEEERSTLARANGFCWETLVDARKAAVTYLTEHAAELEGEARAALERAAATYRQLVALFATGDWEKGREQQIELLSESRKLDSAAIAELEKALAMLEKTGMV